MKKELKGFVCGVLTTALVAGGAAFAAGQWKTIDVLENDITVMVDGVQLNESNFLYNDRTYLPLRAVAEAVGKPVEYDEETNTAYIGNSETTKTFTEAGIYNDKTYLTIYEDETGEQYVDYDEINSLTARTGVFTSINTSFDGTWTFSEWDKDLSTFVDKSTGTCILCRAENGDIKIFIPKSEYDEKIKPILYVYVERLR